MLLDVTAGHDWYRVPKNGSYAGACSCGWRSADEQQLGRMLLDVKDHLEAARQESKTPAGLGAADASQVQPDGNSTPPAQASSDPSETALTHAADSRC